MIRALAEAGAVLERDGLRRRRAPRRGVRARRDARRRRPPAAHLQRRRGEAQRLPRGPRLHARGAAGALRGDLRAALVSSRARARRRHHRALRRPRARRLLSDLQRPRAARRPAQGDRRLADPVGPVERRVRPAAPRRADRRGPLRGRRASACCALFGDLLRRSPLAFGHLLQALDFHLAPVREVALVGAGHERARRASCAARSGPTSCSPAATARTTAACRCWPARAARDGAATAYVCERFTCQAPVTEPARSSELLRSDDLSVMPHAVEVRAMSSLLTVFAGRRAKWVIAADLGAGDLRLVRRRTCPASSPTPRRTSRRPFCPATPSRRRR